MRLIKREDTVRARYGWWRLWLLAIVLTLSSGIVYRFLASKVEYVLAGPVTLPINLSNFPRQIGEWAGTDLPIATTTRAYMEQNFADDYLSRRYVNSKNNTWADFYLVYCSSRPGGILGHRPRICYTGAGWVHDGTETSSFVSQTGKRIPCLIHRFHRPVPPYQEVVVLNYYLLNGEITTDEDQFSSPLGRRPNIGGDLARYVAQVQISSVLESSVRAAAEDFADIVASFLPDPKGVVRAARLYNNEGNASGL